MSPRRLKTAADNATRWKSGSFGRFTIGPPRRGHRRHRRYRLDTIVVRQSKLVRLSIRREEMALGSERITFADVTKSRTCRPERRFA